MYSDDRDKKSISHRNTSSSAMIILQENLTSILHNTTHPPVEFTNHPPAMNTTFVLNNPDLCKNSPDLKYIIYVHTAPAYKDRRKVIRSTWASPTLFKKNITKYEFSFLLCSILSLSNFDQTFSFIFYEHRLHGDIVQLNRILS